MDTVFRCQLSGMNREIKFRQITLRDEIKIQEQFPDYSNKITTTHVDMSVLTEIVWMTVKNKDLFKPIERQEIGKDGKTITVSLGGLDLLRENVKTESDQASLLCAFIEIMKKSRPEAEELVKKKRTSRRLIFSLSLMLCLLATGGLIAKLWISL